MQLQQQTENGDKQWKLYNTELIVKCPSNTVKTNNTYLWSVFLWWLGLVIVPQGFMWLEYWFLNVRTLSIINDRNSTQSNLSNKVKASASGNGKSISTITGSKSVHRVIRSLLRFSLHLSLSSVFLCGLHFQAEFLQWEQR